MIVLLTLLLISNASANDKISGHYQIDDGGPTVDWSMDASIFEATLTMKQRLSWVSLGVSPNNGKMMGSDAFIAVGKQIYRVQLGLSGSESRAFQTEAEAYADGSIIQNSSSLVVNVRRPLDTDKPWQVQIHKNKPTTLIVAWRVDPSPSGLLGKHSGHHSQVINSDGAVLAVREEAKVARNDLLKQFSLPNTGLQVSYSIIGDKITFHIASSSETWIGIGFSEQFSMHPSLAIIGQKANQVQAYLLTSDNVGSADSQLTSELSNVNFESSNGKSRLQFTRPLKWASSGVSKFFDIDPNGESIVIAAIGQSTTLGKHTAEDMSKVSWSSASSTSKGSTMRTIAFIHGAVMIIAWLFLMPIGGVIARYFKDSEFRWFRFHRAIMLATVALTFLSFVLIVWARAGKLFDTTHGAIGFFVVFLAFMQPLLTVFRNKARPLWKLQHRITTAILFIGATINCYIGANILRKVAMNVIMNTVITILLGFCVISVIFLEIKRGRSSYQAENDIKEEDENRTRAFD